MSTRVIETITAEDIARHRAALCAWAEANGLVPKDVADRPGITVERVGRRTVIVFHEYQRGADGKVLVDLDRGEGVTVRRSVTQVETLAQHGYPGAGSESDQAERS
ncbi:hypothetical protein J3A78_003498 [Streptomyces sp. PvR006]|uniref:hypothetical protein n=1 Tax=Streptomyces sp. PvR006 TaxID=2817860 RepID=UPI001AE10246|nr:hypothetical protein [Streptomyces sp. PvR006]MBP2583020.1 hypothetical protein [Streptomyces sp. PvR006]